MLYKHQEYSKVAAPLTQLLKGGVKGPKNSGPRRKANPPIIWNEHLDESFNKLKHLVTTAPMLHIVDPSKPFVVETDASDYALGAALYQDGRPIAFESKKLSDAEMRYPTYEKELYAVIHALKKWRHYLYGSKFIAWTDHHSLRYICDQDDLRGRKARWVELMQEFDFEIRYRKGSTNKVADALSRIPEVNALSMAEISTDFYLALRGLCRSDRHFRKVWNEVGKDPRIKLLMHLVGFLKSTPFLWLKSRQISISLFVGYVVLIAILAKCGTRSR
ncbi:hypothetical protein L7F22_056609 [Adiantum nelumboides]|nr:hypothetical protein [Adiantum nelumboides]